MMNTFLTMLEEEKKKIMQPTTISIYCHFKTSLIQNK